MNPTPSEFAQAERGCRLAHETFYHAMIHAYFDDSSDPLMAKYAACGGILGDEFNLTFTENLWVQETKHLAEPFRSTDCECNQGQFREVEKSDCNSLMARLIDILCQPLIRVGAMAVVVPIAEYRRVFPESERNDPYKLAMRMTLLNLVYQAEKRNERARIWFESGPSNHDALTSYNEVSKCQFPNASMHNRLIGISFQNKTFPLLQAADMVARESFKAALNHGQRPTRIPLKRLWEQAGIIVIGEHCLNKLRDAGGPFDPLAIDSIGPGCRIEERRDNAYSYGPVRL